MKRIRILTLSFLIVICSYCVLAICYLSIEQLPGLILETPIWICLILPGILIAIFKIRKLTIRIAAITLWMVLVAGLIWASRTHSPTEKVHSEDGQYSFYMEKYNYNAIYEHLPLISAFHTWKEDEYKLFLYDEIEQKLLRSGYVGEIYWNDKIGFPLYDNTEFHWGTGVYYKLPRPVDEKALAKVNNKTDTINRTRREEEMQPLIYCPKITEEAIAVYEPMIRKWLDHFEVELSDAHLVRSQNILTDAHDKIEKKHSDAYKKHPEMIYSPNGQRFISMGYPSKLVNGEYVTYSDKGFYWIHLHDMEQDYYQMLATSRFDAVYWINDDVFITVGERKDVLSLLQLCVFDLKEQTLNDYGIKKNEKRGYTPGEYHQIFLKEKGIPPLTEYKRPEEN